MTFHLHQKGTPAAVHFIIAHKGSNEATSDKAIYEQSTTSKNGNHHSTNNYLMVDSGIPRSVQRPTIDFCHTFTSKSGVSSTRSRAASAAWLHKSSSQLLSRSAIKHRLRRKKKKTAKQSDILAIIGPTDERTVFGKKFSTHYLQE